MSEKAESVEKESEEVDKRKYRAIAARANYLAQDRIDVQFAAKEVSRLMSKPEGEDWRKVKRLGRYLKDKLRAVMEYKCARGRGVARREE